MAAISDHAQQASDRLRTASRLERISLVRIPGLPETLSLMLMIAGYVTVLYFLLPENSLLSFPFMPDDYLALLNTSPTNVFLRTRPVHQILTEIATIGGMESYYIALSVLSVLGAWLVYIFVARLCGQKPPLLWSFFFALVVFSSSTYVWAGKFNVLTNHGSMVFGVLAMLAILVGYEKQRTGVSLLGVVLFTLSIFAKEDYFLPVLCVAAYCVIKGGLSNWKRSTFVLMGLVAVVLLFTWHTLRVVSFSHVMLDVEPSHPYAQNFSIMSVVTTFGAYLTAYSLPSPLLLLLFAVAVGYATLIARRLEYYLLIAIILSLFAPYSILPNHITSYNAINWIPWMTAFMLVLVPSRIDVLSQLTRWSPPIAKAAITIVLGVIAVGTIVQSHDARAYESRYFARQAEINLNIVNGLLAYRTEIASASIVGIVGVEGWSPWLRTQAEYLSDRGFDNQWALFVWPNSFYGEQLADDPYQQANPIIEPGRTVSFLRMTDLQKYPDLPLLEFDKKGNPTRWGTRAREYFPTSITFSPSDEAQKRRGGAKEHERAVVSGLDEDGWMETEAVVLLTKPAGATTLDVSFEIPERPEFREKPQDFTITIGQMDPQTLCCFGPGQHDVSLALPAKIQDSLGTPEIRITLGTTFISGGDDPRQLGARLYRIGFGPGPNADTRDRGEDNRRRQP